MKFRENFQTNYGEYWEIYGIILKINWELNYFNESVGK